MYGGPTAVVLVGEDDRRSLVESFSDRTTQTAGQSSDNSSQSARMVRFVPDFTDSSSHNARTRSSQFCNVCRASGSCVNVRFYLRVIREEAQFADP
jgi:hypothetical protein